MPTVVAPTKNLLKVSGNKSKPFVGDVRVKKISGPPKPNTNDWDSSDVVVETKDVKGSFV